MAKQYVGKNTVKQLIKNTKAELIKKVSTSDIVDDLTTADNTKVLSANQGKVLMDKIATLDSNGDGAVDNTATLGGHTPDYFATAESVQEQVTDQKGQPDGLAPLDEDGKISSKYLPSFVDDVLEGYLVDGVFYEDEAHATEFEGERSKIYIDLITNQSYRWSGTEYIEITSPDMEELEEDYIRSIYDSIAADKKYTGSTEINTTVDLANKTDEETMNVIMNPLEYISTNCDDIQNAKVLSVKVVSGKSSIEGPTVTGNVYNVTVKDNATVGSDVVIEFIITSDNYKNITLKYTIEVTKSIIDIATLGITDATGSKSYNLTPYTPKVSAGELVEGTDYEIELLTDGMHAGTQRYKVKGIGNYDGEIELSFEIRKKGITFYKLTMDDPVINSDKNPSVNKVGLQMTFSIHNMTSLTVPESCSNVIGEYFTFPEESGKYNYILAKKTFDISELLIDLKEAGLEMSASIDDLTSYGGTIYSAGDHIDTMEEYTFSKFSTVDWDASKFNISNFEFGVSDVPYDGNIHNFEDVELIKSISYSGDNKFVENGKVTGLVRGIDYEIGNIVLSGSTDNIDPINPGKYYIYFSFKFCSYASSITFNITKGTREDKYLTNMNGINVINWPDPCNMTMKIPGASIILGGTKGDFTYDIDNVKYQGTPTTILSNIANSVAYDETADMITYVISGNKSDLIGKVNGTILVPVISDLYNNFNAKINISIISE